MNKNPMSNEDMVRLENLSSASIECRNEKLLNALGFDKRLLYRYVQFYQTYPEIVGIATSQSGEYATIDKNRKDLTW